MTPSRPKIPDQTPHDQSVDKIPYPAQKDDAYPAGMERHRGPPKGIGDDKPGPRNPEPPKHA